MDSGGVLAGFRRWRRIILALGVARPVGAGDAGGRCRVRLGWMDCVAEGMVNVLIRAVEVGQTCGMGTDK
jgi:hypothetical protein